MSDNRLTLTIEAQNLAQAAFRQLQADVRQSNDALQKTGQVGQRVSAGIKVLRDEFGRAGRSIQQAGRNTAQLTDQFVGLYRSSGAVRQLGKDFRFLQNNIQATSGVVQQFTRNLTAQTQAIIEQAARVERLKLGLETLSPSIQEAEEQYRELIDVARLPGIDFSNALQADLQLQAIGESGKESIRILKAFGNALALGGASTADIQRVIYGLRQLIADGVVLQRELNIVTSRVPVAVPIIQERFGSIRAEGIREHFDNLGVDPSNQAREFIKILTEELEKLPSAADTASNAIENLGDTFRRAQAAAGEGLLPIVKETIASIESLLFTVEKDEGLKTAIADWLAFATAMGTVTAGVVGVAAVIPLLGGLLNPIGLTALAVGALAGAFVKAEVAAARLRAEYSRTQDALQAGLRVGQGESTEAIEKEIARLEARRTFLQGRIASLREEAEAERSPTAALATTHLQDESLRVSTERQTEAILEQNDAYKTYQSQLFQVDKAIEVLTRRTDKLSASQQDAADTTENNLARAFRSLTDAASGTDAQIAEALQRFENVSQGADNRVTDLALDIGDQLVAIAESTSTKQIEASKRRVDALARDNSLIIADSEQLQALILAGEKAFYARRRQLREKENAAYHDQFTLESHDQEAQELTNALLQFQDLQRDVQEAVRLDAKQSAEGQATAYIKAYRDSIDPAILNLVESVKLLRAEVRGSIQDLEHLQRQDAFKLDVHGEIGGEQRDALAELFDLQQAVQGDLTQNQIDNLNKRAEALKTTLANETLSLQSYVADATAIQEQLRDKSLELLGDVVQARQAAFEDEAKTERQAEERKREENAKTYDFHTYLNGLRRKSVQEATQELSRLEERALDASSQRQRENLIRETQQFIDEYAQRGQAFKDLVTDAQDLGADLQQAFDLTEQQKRLEDFQDSVAGVLENLAGITIDHIFDSFSDSAQRATDAVATFTDEVRGELQLLQSDITRLTRFDEDQGIRRERLIEDRDRRIQQLRRQQQALAARGGGSQQNIERNIQRQQDISFRIAQLREDFGVRLTRFDEDRDRRRERTIEDALQRRERFEARGGGDASLISKLLDSLANSLSNTLSSTISSAIASALAGALGGQFNGLLDAIKGLFTGGSGTTETPTVTTPTTPEGTTPAGQITPDITPPAEPIDLKGKVALALADITAPTESIALKGAIALTSTDITAPVGSVPLKGAIALSLADITAPTEAVPLTGVINATVNVLDPQPIPLTGIINATVNPTNTAIDLSQIPVTPPQAIEPPITLPATIDASQIPITPAQAIAPAVSLPDSIDASQVPVSLPDASLDVDTPASFDLSGALVTLPDASLDVDAPTSFDLSEVPVSLPDASLDVNTLGSVDLSGVPVTLPEASLDVDTPGAFDLSEVPVLLPDASLDVKTPGAFDLSEVPVSLPPASLDVALNLPDTELLPPIDLGGLRLTNAPTVPIVFAPDLSAAENALNELLDGQSPVTPPPPTPTASETPTTGQSIAETVANEGRRDKVFGSGNPTVQTNITSDELTKSLAQGAAEGVRSGLHDLPRQIAEAIQGAVGAVLSSGVAVGGDGGVTLGGSATDQLNQDVADSLQAEGSFRSDVVPTLLGNQPGQVQPGSPDPDDDTAQAPAAIGTLTAASLAGLATESTLSALTSHAAQIAANTGLLTELPLISSLAGQGVSVEDARNTLNLGERQTDLLNQLQSAHGIGPTPDLSQIAGGSQGSPLFVADTTRPKVQDVRLVGGKIESVGSVGEIKKQVDVKHVGALEITQGGQFVVTLASGAVLPVTVAGGRMTVDIGGGLEGLAVGLADVEVGLQAEGAI